MTTPLPPTPPATSGREPAPAPESLLYHYTGNQGLLGIVQNQCLWATRAQYLNDAKELAHTYDIALSLLEEFEHRNPSGIAAFRGYLNGLAGHHTAYIFLSSLSERGDSLSQWRAYGRAGDSYSLGFVHDELADAAAGAGWRLASCVYALEDQQRLVRTHLEAFCTAFELGRYGPDPDPDPASRFLRYCYAELLNIAPLIKHAAFEEEREWRLISPIAEAGIQYRVGRQSLVPSIIFKLPAFNGTLRIPQTIVGPGGADSSGASDALVSLYNDFHVRTGQSSSVAFRTETGERFARAVRTSCRGTPQPDIPSGALGVALTMCEVCQPGLPTVMP